jgi:diaminohydroxyphosphoribosylaminopyrimidine deaminase / 5-amino-6-(5-phosphoribosylamino)uracil reductase
MPSDLTSDFDVHMMAIALRMAARGLGMTAPNPSVGAVIADEATGEVIARAVTALGGRPHAETLAIDMAGARCRGAMLYVTLEPCSHIGKTAPCADAVIAAGFRRVVLAIEDPDPRVAGRGVDRMRAAGIEVVRGVGAAEARWITRGHIVRVTERRPFVTIKMATAADGSIARGDGDKPVFATGEIARQHGHMLRAQHDAILVGEGTARDDDPDLTCRLPGLNSRSPLRVVLSRTLSIRIESRLVQTARTVPVLVVCAVQARRESSLRRSVLVSRRSLLSMASCGCQS